MKYVIIGTGNISNTYVNAISELKDSKIVACVSRNGNRITADTKIPDFPSLESIPVGFDAVIVATPNGLHCEGILAAARSGKHVITEKPLGINRNNMKAVISACNEKNVTLAVAYQRRTTPDNKAIKQLLKKGVLGKVFAADLTAKFYRDQAYYDSAGYRGGYSIDGGGPFMQQACHNIDIYVWFFGFPAKVVSMMDTFIHNMEAEDHGAALLKHDNGMIGTIIASTAAKPGFAARLEVHSEKGSFIMIDDTISEWHFDNIPNPVSTDFEYQHDGAKSASVSDVSAHKEIIKDFEKVVKKGGTPIADPESARQTTELILDIYGAVMK